MVRGKQTRRGKLKKATKRGALIGAVLGPIAAAMVTGLGLPVVTVAYTLDWAAAFALAGAWVGAMFFAGEEGEMGTD